MKNRAEAQRALRRLLANGRLTALPKRPADLELVAALAATRFDASDAYVEGEVNDRLEAWLESISEPHGIDHVSLRRLLVDSRLLTRTTSGSTYRVNPSRLAEIDGVRGIDPAVLLSKIREERNQRKRRNAA